MSFRALNYFSDKGLNLTIHHFLPSSAAKRRRESLRVLLSSHKIKCEDETVYYDGEFVLCLQSTQRWLTILPVSKDIGGGNKERKRERESLKASSG